MLVSKNSTQAAELKEIAFILDDINHWQEIAAAIPRECDIIVVNHHENAIAQICHALSTRSGLNAIHLLSHAQSAQMQLGSITLNPENLCDFSSSLASIGRSLHAQGEILLYGCQLAEGEAGKKFIQKFALLCNASVAASNNLTGHALQNADWCLQEFVASSQRLLQQKLHTKALGGIGEFAHWNGTLGNTAPSFSPKISNGKTLIPIGNGDDSIFTSTLQKDGKIVVAGDSSNGKDNDYSVLRLNSDGTVDTSFASNGKIIFPIGTGFDDLSNVKIQDDGKILLAGTSSNGTDNDFSIARLNPDGSFDTSFNATGKALLPIGTGNDTGYRIMLQADGKILFAGQTVSKTDNKAAWALIRLNTDGSLDTSFASAGKSQISFEGNKGAIPYAIQFQPDGKIVIAGLALVNADNDFGIARLNPDGSLDTSFDTDGIANYNLSGGDIVRGMSILPDGKIMLSGSSTTSNDVDFSLLRLNSNGSLDTTFNNTGKLIFTTPGVADNPKHMAVQNDGKIILAGSSSNGKNQDFSLIRINPDGSLDPSFNGTGKVLIPLANGDDLAYTVIVQSDNKILLSGTAQNDSNKDFAVIRLNPDGSLDQEFNGMTLGGSISYTTNTPAVALDTSVAIYDDQLAALDAGAGNYNGASISVSRHGGASAQDIFSAHGNLSFTANTVLLSGTQIGSLSNSNGSLSITFNASATQARVNQLLSNIYYANNSDAASSKIIIDWVFNDGNTQNTQGTGGDLSVTGNTFITLKSSNDSPANQINGSVSDDTLTGTQDSDLIKADAGNDLITGNGGNDTIDGGSGLDTVAFNGKLTNFKLSHAGPVYTVEAISGTDGKDTLSNVETLKFSDFTVNLTIQALASSAPEAQVQSVLELYAASFNQLPNADQIAPWISEINAGKSLDQIAQSLYKMSVAQPNKSGFSDSMSNLDFVNSIYQNVLGRSSDAAGLTYWSDKLSNTSENRGSLLSEMLVSAHTYKSDPSWGWVANLLENKISVAKTFAIDWGLNDTSQANTVLTAVTATDIKAALSLIGIAATDINLTN